MGTETLEKLPLEGVEANEELLDSLAGRLAERVAQEPHAPRQAPPAATAEPVAARRNAAMDRPLSTTWTLVAAGALAAIIAGAFVLIALFGPAPTP
ncbi:MAG: hypothetical protein R3C15_01150 [Thermoleophilia bacterium]